MPTTSSGIFGDASRTPADDDSLVEGGVIDSTGILELIEFLESYFGIEVSDTETVPQNLGTLSVGRQELTSIFHAAWSRQMKAVLAGREA